MTRALVDNTNFPKAFDIYSRGLGQFDGRLIGLFGAKASREEKMSTEYFNEAQVSDGLKARVKSYMRARRFNLDEIAALLRSERRHIADWFIGAAPAPESLPFP